MIHLYTIDQGTKTLVGIWNTPAQALKDAANLGLITYTIEKA